MNYGTDSKICLTAAKPHTYRYFYTDAFALNPCYRKKQRFRRTVQYHVQVQHRRTTKCLKRTFSGFSCRARGPHLHRTTSTFSPAVTRVTIVTKFVYSCPAYFDRTQNTCAIRMQFERKSHHFLWSSRTACGVCRTRGLGTALVEKNPDRLLWFFISFFFREGSIEKVE